MSIHISMDSVKSFCNVAGFRFVVVALSKLWTLVLYLLRRNLKMIIQHKTIKYDVYPLTPLSIERLKLVKKKTLVLDLDETLVHAHHDGVPVLLLLVMVDILRVSQWYNLVVFTASTEQYGSAVTDHLDNNRGILNRRYFRQHCSLQPFHQGYSLYVCYVKELSKVCDDLSSVFILDNSPEAYSYNLDNAIAIKSWFADPSDTALLNLLPMLDALRFVSDVRSILGRRLHTYVNR
ncbi:hypothetical protein QZH41_010378 [Actinostola sp. cb2023]|nr:hypothetical protein QZH41_010378 [Actinostola sp. cb2023]